MQLQMLMHTHRWEEVRDRLLMMYPEMVINADKLKVVYATLLALPPTFSDIEINVETAEIAEEDDQGWLVYGTEHGTRISHSLEFTAWQEWMSMCVNRATLDLLGEVDLICHCLCEITLMGYTEEEIAQIRNDINRALDEYKGWTKEEEDD